MRSALAGVAGRADRRHAIARCEAVNPVLNGLAHETFVRGRWTGAEPAWRGNFDGVPTFFKTTSTSRACRR